MFVPMKALSKFLEVFWLLLGVATLVFVFYLVNQQGFEDSKVYFLFPVIAFSMFFFRRFMRRKLTEMEERRSKES